MNLKRTTAGQLMTKRIVAINASDNLRHAALKMEPGPFKARFRRA